MTAETLTALAERVEALSGACPETDVLIVQGSLPMSAEKVARAIPDEAVEAALEAHWRVAPIGAKDMASAMRAAIVAALAAMGEREDLSGYASDRVFDGVRTLPPEAASAHVERVQRAMGEPVAWRVRHHTEAAWRIQTERPADDPYMQVQPLYASPRPVEEAVKAERAVFPTIERELVACLEADGIECEQVEHAWTADISERTELDVTGLALAIATAIRAGEGEKG